MDKHLVMQGEPSRIRYLQDRWKQEDATRDELERRAKQGFLEQQAQEIFAPIENYFTRLSKVLHAIGAVVEVDPSWEHAAEQRLRRRANVRSNRSGQQFSLELTFQGWTIFYRETPYPFLQTEALIPIITSDIEQFLSRPGCPAGS